jgi:hypothetical protein
LIYSSHILVVSINFAEIFNLLTCGQNTTSIWSTDLHFETGVNNAKTAPGLGIWRMALKVDGCCGNAATQSAQLARAIFAVTTRLMRAPIPCA